MYLKSKWDWQWINNATFKPAYGRNILNIDNPNDPSKIIQIRIYDNENKAYLVEDGNNIDEFTIRQDKFVLNIETKTSRKKTDMILDHIIKDCENHRLAFLTKLKNKVKSESKWHEIFIDDEMFVQALAQIDIDLKKELPSYQIRLLASRYLPKLLDISHQLHHLIR